MYNVIESMHGTLNMACDHDEHTYFEIFVYYVIDHDVIEHKNWHVILMNSNYSKSSLLCR